MGFGPVEILVIAFPGSRFNGEIAPALQEVVDKGDVRIIDLVFIGRDADGNLLELEASDVGDEALAALDPIEGKSPLVTEDDIEAIASVLEPGSSAAVLVFEHSWAAKLSGAVAGSGGQVIYSERIPGPVVDAAVAEFAS